jgi:YVTN family beta-propeller protein
MRVVLRVIVFLVLANLAFGQTTPSLYKQVAKWEIGGDGGWDYISYDGATNRVYIGHSSLIEVVDAQTGKKVGSVPAQGAHGVAVVADKGLGFSTNGRAGTVTVFDLNTLTPKQEIKAGENPDAIMYDPYSKQVIVMNGRSKDVSVIDPVSLKVVATIPLGGKLEAAASDPGHIYVNVEDTGEVGVIDSKTWQATGKWKIEGCEEPSGLSIDEKSHHLFPVCGNKQMAVVNSQTGKVEQLLPTGAGTDGGGFDTGLKYAFSSNGSDGTLTVVHQGKDGKWEVLENAVTQRGARTMAVDSKSHKVYVATAEFGPPVEGQRRPPIKPGSFMVLVYAPSK